MKRPLLICLCVCLAGALAIRLFVADAIPSINRPDEIFQNLEPAHRLWNGWGVISWEWRDGIRSWLFPGFLAGLMAVSSWLGLGADGYLTVIPFVLSCLSLGVVAAGVMLGWRRHGAAGAAICGAITACWPELVYFAPKTLGEVQAGHLLVIAAFLADPGDVARPRGRVRAVAIGALLGLGFCLRFHLAPAMLVVALWTCRRDWRGAWPWLLAGAAGPLLLLGAVDWASWGTPFQSVWKNFEVNLVEGKSDTFGVLPPEWFLLKTIAAWGATLLPVAVFFILGARSAPLLALVAIVVIVSHSLIAHKELSFIFAALPCVLIVAGLGTARVVSGLARLLGAEASRLLAPSATILWVLTALLTAGGGLDGLWTRGSAVIPAWDSLRMQTGLCGVGVYGEHFPVFATGGYSRLNRPVPIYLLRSPADLAAAAPGINAVIAMDPPAPELSGFAPVLCERRVCLLRREGACSPVDAGLLVNAVLKREGL